MAWIVRILVIVLAAVILALGAFIFLPGERIARIAADQIELRTGRDLQISGDLRVTIWPVLGVQTGPIVLGNAKWASEAPMLQAEALSIGISTSDLLRGQLRVRQILAQAPILRLEQNKGRQNWQFGTGMAEVKGEAAGTDVRNPPGSGIALEVLELQDARLIYVVDGSTRLDQGGVDLEASWQGRAGPLEFRAVLSPNGVPVAIDGTLSDVPAFLNGAVAPVSANASLPDAELVFDGRASPSGEGAGHVRLTVRDSAPLLKAAGHAGVLPVNFGKSGELTAMATYTADSRLSLRNTLLRIDDNTLRGAIDFTAGQVPQVMAELSASVLTVPQNASDKSAAGAETAGDTGWSEAPIDASPLSLAEGVVGLRFERIEAPGVSVGPGRLLLTLERSRAVLQMDPLAVFGGTIRGQLVANNRSGFSVGGNISAEGIELRDALSFLAGVDRLSASAAGNLRFLGVGQTEAQIMRSLSGEGRLQTGQGEIAGLDLDRLISGDPRTGGTTVFNSLTGTFTMAGGKLDNQDLLLRLDNFETRGSGVLGVGMRDLDYLITPISLRANAGKGLSVPVRIRGPWSDLSYEPDLQQLLETELELDVEAEAKAQIRRKLEEELDRPLEEGEDIGDAIKDRLEEEAKKGFLKLLGVD
ncbi:AsmA family protein [Primorskyibacter sp. S87]|uniref:AsmA family protein n=1 Tax=Primorskyibacter sp. S87 TaxID=3415126 RepID=UPI003C7CCFFE